MKTRTKIILWTLPILVIFLEILYNYVFNSGLTVPWKFLGKPSENISKIIGVKIFKIYVYTDSGEMFSLPYYHNLADPFPAPIQWSKENNFNIAPDPLLESGYMPFTSPSPPFKVKQIYQFSFPQIEDNNVNKFALSEDGNLWFWSYAADVYQGLQFLLILTIEILAYLLVLFIGFVIFLTKRIKMYSNRR